MSGTCVAIADEDKLLFGIGIYLYSADSQSVPLPSISSSGFVAGFTVDEEECRIASACLDVDLSPGLADEDRVEGRDDTTMLVRSVSVYAIF